MDDDFYMIFRRTFSMNFLLSYGSRREGERGESGGWGVSVWRVRVDSRVESRE